MLGKKVAIGLTAGLVAIGSSLDIVGEMEQDIGKAIHRKLSRMTGKVFASPIEGSVLREVLYASYGVVMGVKLEEAEKPLHEYRSFDGVRVRENKSTTLNLPYNPLLRILWCHFCGAIIKALLPLWCHSVVPF